MDSAAPKEETSAHVINKIDKITKTATKQTTTGGPDNSIRPEDSRRPLTDKQTAESIATVRHHYLADELVQLTCAFELNDELDLDYSQLEWWLLMDDDSGRDESRRKVAKMIWRSRSSQAAAAAAQATLAPMKDEPATRTTTATTKMAAAAIIMDYVTRARHGRHPGGVAPMNQTEPLVRVSHLIADAAKIAGQAAGNNRRQQQKQRQDGEHQFAANSKRRQQRTGPEMAATGSEEDNELLRASNQLELLCRITNQAGHAELIHSVLVVDAASSSPDPNLGQAQLEARARQQTQDSWLHLNSSSSSQGDRFARLPDFAAPDFLQSGAAWSTDRAKARVADELAATGEISPNNHGEHDEDQLVSEDEPLFIPLYLSRELLDAAPPTAAAGNITSTGKEIDFQDSDADDLAARSLSQLQQPDLHQRQATRQTNSSSTLTSLVKNNDLRQQLNSTRGSIELATSSATYRRKLQTKALALVRKFTATSRMGSGDSDDDAGGIEFAGSRSLVGGLNGAIAGSQFNNLSDEPKTNRARLWLRSVYVRYLDRWLQFAIGEAPLLLSICASLFLICILTTFFMLRLHCAKQRRVRDLADPALDNSNTRALGQYLVKSSLSESPSTDSRADMTNSPDDHVEGRDHMGHEDEVKDKKQPSGACSSNDLSQQQKLISIPSPDDFGEQSSRWQATLRSSPSVARDGVALSSNTDFSHSSYRSGETSLQQSQENFLCSGRNYSTLNCNRRAKQNRRQNFADSEHRLVVVSPQQEMQEFILAPYMPFGDEQPAAHDPYASNLCYHLEQQVDSTVALAGWQSPLGCQEPLASSSSTLQSAFRPPALMMTAPSKLSSNEDLNSCCRNSDLHSSISLSRNLCDQEKPSYAQNHQVAGVNYGYASSSSLVTSPAASTSSTSMTSGNQMTQHALHACKYDHLPKRSHQDMNYDQQQNRLIYLEDALKLLHSSMNNCLQ